MFGRLAMGFANVRAGTLESTNAGAGAGAGTVHVMTEKIQEKKSAVSRDSKPPLAIIRPALWAAL